MVHSINGNPYDSTNKGRGKTKNQRPQQSEPATAEALEEAFQKAVWDSLPEAAKRRVAPQLSPAEWPVPIFHHTEMSSAGGICVCPKHAVPGLIQQVGHTKAPAAMLCTQHPSELGLKGYPSEEVTCSFNVKEDDGSDKTILVKRFLVQLGFGQHVHQQVDGDLVHIGTTMHKFTIKLPFIHGWRPEACTARSIAKILDQRIATAAYDHIITRQDQSATVYVHESEVQKLLRTSGQEAVFLKLHESSPLYPEADILWLPTDHSLDDANALAQADDTTLGVIAKNSKVEPRYAVRFGQKADLQNFAKKHHIEDLSPFGRWRLTGLPLQTGAVGALQLLESRGWDIKEILFMNESQCSFLAVTRGNTSNMHYVARGVKHPLQIKAINAIAKDEQAAASKAAAAKAATPIQSGRPQAAVQRMTWTRSMAAKSALEAPASPRRAPQGEAPKRATAAKTGNTPEQHKQRTE